MLGRGNKALKNLLKRTTGTKEARAELRRWTFAASIEHADGTSSGATARLVLTLAEQSETPSVRVDQEDALPARSLPYGGRANPKGPPQLGIRLSKTHHAAQDAAILRRVTQKASIGAADT
jgi:hypothetical protein